MLRLSQLKMRPVVEIPPWGSVKLVASKASECSAYRYTLHEYEDCYFPLPLGGAQSWQAFLYWGKPVILSDKNKATLCDFFTFTWQPGRLPRVLPQHIAFINHNCSAAQAIPSISEIEYSELLEATLESTAEASGTKEYRYIINKVVTLYIVNGLVYSSDIPLEKSDVIALATEQANKKLRRLERARALMDMNQTEDSSKTRRSIPQEIKLSIWRRDQGRCVICGSNANLEFDHVIPVSLGGANTERNLQLLCMECNRRKGASL